MIENDITAEVQRFETILLELVNRNKLISRRWSWVGSNGEYFFKIQKITGDLFADFKNEKALGFIRNEYSYLRFLKSLDSAVVNPIQVLKNYSCLVMEQINGWNIYSQLKKGGDLPALQRAIDEGIILAARIHRNSPDCAEGIKKYDYSKDRFFPPSKEVMRELEGHQLTVTSGGFEIRNCMWDEDSNRVRFFDPHHVHMGAPEDDFSRYVISVLMVNWGQKANLSIWDNFNFGRLIDLYEETRGVGLNKNILYYSFNRNLAMREHFANCGIDEMPIYKQPFGKIYKGIYFKRIQAWRKQNCI